MSDAVNELLRCLGDGYWVMMDDRLSVKLWIMVEVGEVNGIEVFGMDEEDGLGVTGLWVVDYGYWLRWNEL